MINFKKSPIMKKSSTVFLQVVIVLIGLMALGLLIQEPRMEGVNAHAISLSQIYLDDPFLWLIYAGSIPFFVALYQAIKVLGYAGRNEIFSLGAVKALRTIKYCAFAIIGFIAVEEAIILLNSVSDDHAAGVMIGLFIAFCSVVVATAAGVFERILQNAVELKSESDLTV
jgi:hypothetical protein